jgi:ParB/RepB/Spo0J family partition protein
MTELRTEQLQPNDYNPNRMTEEEFAEFVEEVRHLGRLPKPVVVRNGYAGDSYQIVDGEHGWRAAKEVGLQEITCEIIEADDFEAMRQTYKRNQHGTHDRVVLGRMFRSMMDERGISARELAKEMTVSDGTVRNALLYAQAAELRNSYAPGLGEKMDSIPVRALRTYVDLPDGVRDAWLDSGADAKTLWEAGTVRLPIADPGGGERLQEVRVENPEDWAMLVGAGLAQHLDGRSGRTFVRSARRLWRLEHWQAEHKRYIQGLEDYVQAAAELELGPEWLEELPLERTSDTEWRPLLSVDAWWLAMHDSMKYADNDKQLAAMAKAAIKVELRKNGHDRGPDQHNPMVAEALLSLNDAPAFIRDADIPLVEKIAIFDAQPADHVPEEVMLPAKQAACEFLEKKQRVLSGEEEILSRLSADKAAYYRARFEISALEALNEQLTAALRDHEHESLIREREELLADRAKFTDATINALSRLYVIRKGTVNERPAPDVLRERLDALPEPEFRLLAALAMGAGWGPSVWLDAVRSEAGGDAPED